MVCLTMSGMSAEGSGPPRVFRSVIRSQNGTHPALKMGFIRSSLIRRPLCLCAQVALAIVAAAQAAQPLWGKQSCAAFLSFATSSATRARQLAEYTLMAKKSSSSDLSAHATHTWLPSVVYGTYQVREGLEECIHASLRSGIRAIDTASVSNPPTVSARRPSSMRRSNRKFPVSPIWSVIMRGANFLVSTACGRCIAMRSGSRQRLYLRAYLGRRFLSKPSSDQQSRLFALRPGRKHLSPALRLSSCSPTAQ